MTGTDPGREDAEFADRVSALERRVETVEDRLEEQEAALQAVRGYVGSVRAVNREVEERADAALAAVRSIERRTGECDDHRRGREYHEAGPRNAPRPGGGGRSNDGRPASNRPGDARPDPGSGWSGDHGDETVRTKVYDRLSGGSADRRRDGGRRDGTAVGADHGDEGGWTDVRDPGVENGDDTGGESPDWMTIARVDPDSDPTTADGTAWWSPEGDTTSGTTANAGVPDDQAWDDGDRPESDSGPTAGTGPPAVESRSPDRERGDPDGSTSVPERSGAGRDRHRSRNRSGKAPDFSPEDWPDTPGRESDRDPEDRPDGPETDSRPERDRRSPDRAARRGDGPVGSGRSGPSGSGLEDAGVGRDESWERSPDDGRDVECTAPWGAPDPVQPSEFETGSDSGEDGNDGRSEGKRESESEGEDEGLLARLQGVL